MQISKSIILLSLIPFFLTLSQISTAQTTLEGGDLAIVGVNANNFGCSGIDAEDRVSFVSFKDITSGTVLDLTDNGWERETANLFGDTEGTMRGTYTGATISAGEVINFVIDNSGNIQCNTHFGWSFVNLNNPPGLTNNLNLNNSGDQLFFMQGGDWDWGNPGGSTHDASYSGQILYGFNTQSDWNSFGGSTQESGLHPDVVPCFHMEPSTGQSDYQKYTGPLTPATQVEWIDRIGNAGNWTTFTNCTDYLNDFPNHNYEPPFVTLPILPSEMSIDCSTCSGGCGTLNTSLIFNLPSVGGPFDVTYTDGTTEFTLTNILDGHIENVTVTSTTTFSLVSVTQADNCPTYSNFAGDAVITISSTGGGGDASIAGGGILCSDNCSIVTVTITGGTAPYELTATFNLPPFSVTIPDAPVPNTSFDIEICSQIGIPYNPTTNTINIPPTIFGAGNITLVSLTDANGCTGTVDPTPLAFTIEETPNAFPASLSECIGTNGMATFDLTSVNNTVNGGNGNTVNWFSDMAGNNSINNPTSYMTSTNTTVYATSTSSSGNCESDVQAVTLMISPAPTAFPASLSECSASSQAFFDLTSVNNIVNGGGAGTVTWFTNSTGTIGISNPANYSSGNGTVYAVVTVNGCESTPVPVTLSITPAPTGVSTSLTECESLIAPTFADFDLNTINNIVNGGTSEPVAWFLDAGTNFPIVTGMLAAQNNTVVYAEVGTPPCVSAPIAVTLLVIPSPSAITPPPLEACAVVGNQALFDLTSLNNTINGGATITIEWYSDPLGNNMIFGPDSYLSPTGLVFAAASNGTCTSSIIAVTLIVTTPPTANTTSGTACDLGNGTASFDLNIIGLDINTIPTNTVNWFLDQNGNVPIPTPYVTGSTTVYASVSDGICSSSIVPITLSVESAPTANANVSAELCDSGNGTADFDLNTLTSSINPNGSLTFNWYSDAAGNNAINSPYNTTSTTIYVEVSNGSCESTLTPVALNVTDGPTATSTSISACDLGNGNAEFDLTTIENIVNGGNGNTVSWYSDIDANNTIPTLYTSSATIIYAVVSAGACSSQPVAITLTIEAAPVANTGVSVNGCDLGDNTSDFDLDAIASMVNSDGNTTISWFLYANQTNPLTSPFNTATTFVYAVVSDGNCNSVATQVDLNVIDPPTANSAMATLCEVSNGEAVFDLSTLENTVNGGTGNSVIWSSDQNGNNPITSPYTTATTVIYAVVSDINCPSAPVAVDLVVESNPTAVMATSTACDIGDGTGDFNLTALENTVNGGTTNTVSWYSDMNGNNPITSPYNSVSTTIYAIVTNGTCSSAITPITLNVENGIVANPASASACDDGTGMATFDLTTLENTVDGGSGYSISWFSDMDGNNLIFTPYTTNTTTVYAIASSGGCSSTPVMVSLTVEAAPSANTGVSINGCNLGDNTSDFDLDAIASMVNSDGNTTISWFLNADQTNPLTSPFNTATTLVYAVVSNGNCNSVATQVDLNVIDSPTANSAMATLCEVSNGEAVFDLSTLESTVNGGTGNTVVWSSDQDGNNPITSPYTTATTIVYAVVSDVNCPSAPVAIDLVVEANPTAVMATSTACDIGDGTGDFNLTALESTVNGGTSNTVNWYSDMNGNNPITPPYNSVSTTIYAIVTNGNCGSAITPITLNVENGIAANPASASACDDGTGMATFDLTTLENTVDGGSGYSISWFSDMDGNNPISTPYTTNTTTVYAIASSGGCSSTPVMVSLTVEAAPMPTSGVSSEACNIGDNTSDFDLDAIATLLNSDPNTLVNWFLTPNMDNPITSPFNTASTSVFAILNLSGCTSNPTEVVLNVLPAPIGNPTSATVCEVSNGQAVFDLTALENTVNGGSGETVTWFSDIDATVSISSPYTTGTTVVYAVVTGANNCASTPVAVDLTVTPLPLGISTSTTSCDLGNGTADFDLSVLENIVNGGTNNTVSWYSDMDGNNTITSPYNTTTVTVFAIVNDGVCTSATIPVTLTVEAELSANPTSSSGCDSGDGTVTFDLSVLENIINGNSGNTVNWYSDIDGNNPISTPYNTVTTTVYATISNGNCVSTPVAIDLVVNDLPIATGTSVSECDQGNGVAEFNLFSLAPQVNGNTTNIVNWYSDALATMPISSPYSTGTTTIFATVTVGNCTSDIVQVDLIVTASLPAVSTTLEACDEGNGIGTFDLTSIENIVNSNTTNMVTWYSDMNANDEIASPITTMATTIYAVVGDGNCISAVVPIQLDVVDAPSISPTSTSSCDEGNGTATFDLTALENIVNNGTGNLVIWYEDPGATNQIFSPYNSASNTIYAIVSIGGCNSVTEAIDLIVTDPPIANPTTGSQCDDGTGTATFNLDLLAGSVNGGNGNTVLWYSDVNLTMPISSPYSISNPSVTIYAVIEDGNCMSNPVGVLLEISNTLIANSINIDVCDDGTGNATGIFDLIGSEGAIGGGNSVSWFSDSNGMTPLSPPLDMYLTSSTSVYAVVSDGNCSSAPVEISLNVLDEIDAFQTSVSVCDDGSGMGEFDLDIIANMITGGNGNTVTWYDDINLTNSISTPYTSGATTIYAVATDGICFSNTVQVTLLISENVTGIETTAVGCDEGNGTATFDLDVIGNDVTTNVNAFISWYSDPAGNNPISTPYNSSDGVIYAVVTNGVCFTDPIEVTLTISDDISANSATIVQCDEGNGTSTFDLDIIASTINGGNGNTVLWFSDPDTLLPLVSPYNSANNIIYAVVTDGSCYSTIVDVTLEISSSIPAFPANDNQCDEGNGVAIFPLVNIENTITGGSGATVNWFEDMNGMIPITPPFSTITNTIYANVIDGNCSSTLVPITLTVDALPIANTHVFSKCAKPNGLANFNLNAIVDEVNGNTTNTVSWFSNPDGSGPISVIQNNTSSTTIYAIVDDGNCLSNIVAVDLEVIPRPDAFETSQGQCDEGGGIATFDLDLLTETVNGGTGYDVSWFENSNQTISITSPFTSSPTIIYAVVNDGTCNSFPVEVELQITNTLDAFSTTDVQCDEGNGTGVFDLDALADAVNGGTGFQVNWFFNASATNPIPSPYTTSPSTVYAVVVDGNCSSIPVPVDLMLTTASVANPASVSACDLGDGTADFILTDLEGTITGNNGNTVLWFEDINLTISITPPYNTTSTSIFAVSANGNCFSAPVLVTLDVTASLPANPTSTIVCNDGSNTGVFDLTGLESTVNGGNGLSVTWYEDMAGNNPITSPYMSSTTIVYAIVDNGSCTSQSVPVNLTVADVVAISSGSILYCDEGNGMALVDLSETDVVINGGTGNIVNWFSDSNATMPINSPITTGNTSVFAVVTDGNCFSGIQEVPITIDDIPTAFPASDTQCDSGNGTADFDLNSLATIVNGGTGNIVNWFSDINGTMPINTPYNTTSTSVFAIVLDVNCTSIIQEVVLTVEDDLMAFPASDTQCDSGNGTADFDLITLATIVNGGTTNTVNWFSDANATMPINSPYNTTSTSVFAVVTNGSCISNIQEVILTIGDNLMAFPASDTQCDIGNGTADFDLTTLATIVNGGTTNTVNWFSDANATTPINSPYNTTSTSVFAVVTNGSCVSNIVEVTLGINDGATNLINDVLCSGDNIMVNGNPYGEANPMGTEIVIGGSSNGCDSVITIDLSFEAAVTGSIDASSNSICPGTDVTITFNLEGASTYDVTYAEGTNPPITLSGISDGHTIVVSPTATMTYTLGQIVPNNSNCNPVIPFSQVTIEVAEISAVIDVTSQYDIYNVSCFGGSDGALVAGPTSGTSPFNYQWNNGMNTPLINNVPAGNYEITITDASGCSATASAEVTQPDEIEFDFISIPPPCSDAIDGQIILNNITGGIGNYEFALDNNPFTSVQGDTTFIDFVMPGFHDLEVTDEFGCIVGANILVQEPAEATVTLGDDEVIELGDSIELQPITNFNPTEIFWSTTAPCLDCISQFVTPTYETEYSILMIDEAGCEARDTVVITVEKFRRVYIPNAFSPDDNGVNDIFYINGGQDVAEIKNFKIFTRWGEVVYSAEDFQPNDPNYGWDGFFKNKKVNPGVYVYFAEIEFKDGFTEIFKGDVTLQR